MRRDRRIPIYGTGLNIRDWLFVDTHVAYLEAIMAGGTPGHSYLIGGDMELTNLDLVRHIHRLFNTRRPDQAKEFEEVFEFVTDRKGHDRRYAIDTSRLRSQFPAVTGGWIRHGTPANGGFLSGGSRLTCLAPVLQHPSRVAHRLGQPAKGARTAIMQTDYSDQISYLIVDTSQYAMAQHALNESQRLFPLANRIVFSDRADGWDATSFIQIPKITSIEEYNELLLAEAWKHVETDFVQIIQWDGHVINPNAFRPQFLEVDYIGAVWPHHKTRRIGNGGFSLRSKATYESCSQPARRCAELADRTRR